MENRNKIYRRLTGLFVSQFNESIASTKLRDEDKERIISILSESIGKQTRLEFRDIPSQYIKDRGPTKELVVVIDGGTQPQLQSQVDDDEPPF